MLSQRSASEKETAMIFAYFLMGLSIMTGVGGVAVHRENMLISYPLREKRTYKYADHFNLLMLVLIGMSTVSGVVGATIMVLSGGPLWCWAAMLLFIVGITAAGWHTQFVFGPALRRQYNERNYSSE